VLCAATETLYNSALNRPSRPADVLSSMKLIRIRLIRVYIDSKLMTDSYESLLFFVVSFIRSLLRASFRPNLFCHLNTSAYAVAVVAHANANRRTVRYFATFSSGAL